MITNLPGKEYLELLPLLPVGERCKHHRCWCVEFNGEFYAFRDNSQMDKDAWVKEAMAQIGLAATLKMLRHFCPRCHTAQ